MLFVILGIALLALKYFQIGFIAGLEWWIVLTPFGLAVVWWVWADKSGYTKRIEMEKMQKRKEDRIEKQRAAMGMLSAKKRRK